MTMKRKTLAILAIIIFAAAVWAAARLYFKGGAAPDVTAVTVSTDEAEYEAEETVWITIRNRGGRSADVYCPVFCAPGNFPTTVERRAEGGWEYFAGFCPSIEPLFGGGGYEDGYYRHPLAAGGSIEAGISGFTAMGLRQDETLRIVYYLGPGKTPAVSNEFVVRK
jgi:hypothetical protein